MDKYNLIVLLSIVLTCCQPRDKITLNLIGDSTCAPKEENKRPETGWGEKFEQFFDQNVIVRNHAVNGRSTRTFIEENRWDSVYSKLGKGDYVFIQFGHNDEILTKASYSTPEDYKTNLKRFISETLSKEAHPVLLTPVCRRRFDDEGNFFDTHGQYASLVRLVARETGVTLIDMHTISMAILVQYGQKESEKLFLHCAPNECPNYSKGIVDDTHFSDLGATVMAEALAKAIADTDLALKKNKQINR
ncbi:rhamnogalacturonan acetylesterase [Algoriphagus sp. D3-2-R+10]|uniref:rhamnogalacturonan acetylesterase n=1 Tax=Algoriphagus aurantiacus TaxID=3103948 RepID=UPI002B38442B|nr:rhamnogalacturonan acetylesterase [Algoriphagus sp. D3-2-R+10]MEB2774673.1 rhamnogalacturonan acetylesterase [Algoriphagus sp. D3-2-R+10]